MVLSHRFRRFHPSKLTQQFVRNSSTMSNSKIPALLEIPSEKSNLANSSSNLSTATISKISSAIVENSTTTTTTEKWSPALIQELLIGGECPPEFHENYCVRGRCFTTQTHTQIFLGIACDCERGYVGTRCQYIDAPHVAQSAPDNTSKLVARVVGLSFAGLILLAILTVLAVAYYRKKKRTKEPKMSDAFRHLKERYAWKRPKNGSACSLISCASEGRGQGAVEKGHLHVICQEKPTLPFWKDQYRPSMNLLTTISAAPWAQDRMGSPAPKTIPHSPTIHVTPSQYICTELDYENAQYGGTIV